MLDQLRERCAAYPKGSPEHDAFLHAIVRGTEIEADEARTDAAIMKSWLLTGAYETPRRSEATDRVLGL